MSSPDPSVPNMNRQHDSPDKSIRDNSGPVATGGNAEVHDRTGLYLSIIAALFSALAFGFSIAMPAVYQAKTDALEARIENLRDRVQTAERESRVATERWNDLKVELAKRGIPASDH